MECQAALLFFQPSLRRVVAVVAEVVLLQLQGFPVDQAAAAALATLREAPETHHLPVHRKATTEVKVLVMVLPGRLAVAVAVPAPLVATAQIRWAVLAVPEAPIQLPEHQLPMRAGAAVEQIKALVELADLAVAAMET
jgi:hypothetical protein